MNAALLVALVAALWAAATNAGAQTCTSQAAPAATPINVPYAIEGATPEIGDVLALAEIGDYRGGFALSPDGRFAALVERRMRVAEDRYHYAIVLVPLDGGQASVIADAGDFLLSAPEGRPDGTSRDRRPAWSPDGRRIAFLVGCAGQGALGVYDRESGELSLITAPAGDVETFAWRDAGTLTIESGPSQIELAAHAAQLSANGFSPGPEYAPLFSRSPAYVPPRRTWRVDAETARAAEIEDEAAPGASAPPSRRTGAWIAPRDPSSNAARPTQALYYATNARRSGRRCELDACSGALAAAWLSADQAQVYFLRREGFAESYPALYAWTPSENAVRRIRREEEALLDCQYAGGGSLICLRETPTRPRALVRIGLGTGALEVLYDPNRDWRRFNLPRTERIEVHDVFGEEAFAHLVYPARYDPGRRYPLVIVQYRSRGFLRGGVGGEYPIWPLSSRGFFVLSVDRPEPRTLRAELAANELTRRTVLDGSEDLMKQSALDAMLDALGARSLIDPARVAITGLSDGAETLYHGLAHSDRFAAAAASSPPTDGLDWSLNSETFRRSRRRDIGLTWPSPSGEDAWSLWWRGHSAALSAERIEAPLLMQLADSEALSAFPLYARLRELGHPVELFIYPGEYHLKWRPRHIALVQTRALDWIEFWLTGVERADPADPGRLARWRALRGPASAASD